MRNEQFPHTFTRGLLKGRTVNSNEEYQRLLKKAHENGAPKRPYKGRRSSGGTTEGTYRLELQVGSMHVVVEGQVAEGDVVNTLLDALAKLPVR